METREGGQVCVEGGNWSSTLQHTIYTVPYGLRGTNTIMMLNLGPLTPLS